MADSKQTGTAHGSPNPSVYVRQPRHHATQGAINDFEPMAQNTPSEPTTTHDSSYTLNSRTPIQSRSYRRARNEQMKFSQGNKYGQYLSVPKGNREIFASREQQSRKRKLIFGIVIAAAIIILLIVFWPK